MTHTRTHTVVCNPLVAVLDAVHQLVFWLNRHHEPDDAEITLRLLKVSEEAGEAAAAWIGATGQNPRKGVTHTRDDVADELADVVYAALVAMASLPGICPATVLTAKGQLLRARSNQFGDHR